MDSKEITWPDNVERIRGLWPSAQWTPEERDLWYEQLKEKNQAWLKEAIDKVATKYSSNKPTLKWVLQAFQEIKASRSHNETQGREKSVPCVQEDRRMAQVSRKEMCAAIARAPDRQVNAAKEEVFLLFNIRAPDGSCEGWSNTAVGLVYASLARINQWT